MNGFENIIGELLGDDDIRDDCGHHGKARIYNQYKVIGKVFESLRLGSDEYLRV